MSEINLDHEIIEAMRSLGFPAEDAEKLTAEDMAALRRAGEWKKMADAADRAGLMDNPIKPQFGQQKICATCDFYSGDIGECRRNPPLMPERPDLSRGRQPAYFPLVSEEEWCGEWSPYEER